MRKPAIGFVLACVFLDALGIGLIVPVLPRLIGSLADTRDLQTSWYGAIMVSYGLMQFFFAPILGALSDRIGRRPVLLTGILGLSIMMIVPAVSQSLPFILLSRLVGGMMSSNIVVAQAYIADVTPSHQRIASFGKIGAIFGIAFVLGPAVGGVLGQTDPKIPFFVASAICALNFLYGFFILPESLRVRSTAPLSLGRLNPFSAIWSLAGNLSLRPLLVVITLFTLAQSLMQCTWALYTEYRYAWTPLMIGMSIFALGLSISLTQGFILPRLEARAGTHHRDGPPHRPFLHARHRAFAVGRGESRHGLPLRRHGHRGADHSGPHQQALRSKHTGRQHGSGQLAQQLHGRHLAAHRHSSAHDHGGPPHASRPCRRALPCHRSTHRLRARSDIEDERRRRLKVNGPYSP